MSAAAGPGPAALVPVPLRVVAVTAETADTVTFTLDPGARAAAFRAEPGQFNMLYVFGAGEVPISVSGDCGDVARIVHTFRAVGPVTAALRATGVGGTVGVRGPFGSAWPLATATGRDLLLVAGGIGLAPLRPVILAALAAPAAFGRVLLFCGARHPDDLLFRTELERWRTEGRVEVAVTVDHAAAGWNGNVGFVTDLLARARFDPAATVAMMCGPEVMMRFAAMALLDRGVPEDCLYLSMERNMKCAVGHCGHCQFGPHFVCRDGPVFRYDRVRSLLTTREI